MKVVKGILVAMLALLGILMIGGGVAPVGIFLIILAVIFFFFMPTKSRKKSREENLEKIGAVEVFNGAHVAGLPIGGADCTITFFKDQIKIEGGGATYNIGIDKVRDVDVKQDTEIQKELSSSLVKGVAGGFLFGPAGAIIGSRAKTKKKMEVTLYLIINYLNKSQQMDSLCFDMGTYENSNGVLLMFQNDMQQRLKKVKTIIPQNNYEVDL